MSEAQTQPLTPIVGIHKEFADPGTGAVASYHVVAAYQVDLRFGGTSAVTFASYVSQETQQAGRQPLAHITLPIKAAPTGDSAQFANWFAERVLADEVTLQPGQTEHPLSGGVAVRAQE